MRAPVMSVTLTVLLATMGGWTIVEGQGTNPPPTPLDECRRIAAANGIDFDICQLNFKCYNIARGNNLGVEVDLIDQFERKSVTVRQSQLLCTPAQKCIGEVCGPTPEELGVAGVHLKCYNITPAGPPIGEVVTTVDQFETETGVKVQASQLLCEGALKNPTIPGPTIP